MFIQYIVYIKFGFTSIQVKWIFVFVSRTPYIQSLKRHVWIYGEPYAHKLF